MRDLHFKTKTHQAWAGIVSTVDRGNFVFVHIRSSKTGKELNNYKLPADLAEQVEKIKSYSALVAYAKANQITDSASNAPSGSDSTSVPSCPVPVPTPAKSSEQGQGILFLEYESTGRGKNTEICEIAVVDQDKNVLFYSLVKPTKRITPDSTKAHGITNDDVGLAPSFADIWQSLTRVIGRKTLAFYNAEQTKRVLRQSCGMAFDSEIPKHFYTLFPHNKVVCLQRMYAQFYGEYSKVTRDYELWNINYACTQQGIVWRDVPNKRADGTAIKAARLYSHIQAYWGAVA